MWGTEDRTAVSRVAAKANGGAAPAGSARQVQDGVGIRSGPGQHADRLCSGQHDKVDLAAAGLFLYLLHHGQRAMSTGADHQPAASPRDVLRDRERGMPVRAAEPLGRGLLALADLPAVNDHVVLVGHAVDSYRTERELGESHADSPLPAAGSYGAYQRSVQVRPGSMTGQHSPAVASRPRSAIGVGIGCAGVLALQGFATCRLAGSRGGSRSASVQRFLSVLAACRGRRLIGMHEPQPEAYLLSLPAAACESSPWLG